MCRYNIRCSGDRLLYYRIVDHSLQSRVTCNGMSGKCVDSLKLIFPGFGMGQCERCGNINDANPNCIDHGGIGKQLLVEFVANRETNRIGFEILATCVSPTFDHLGPGSKRQAEQCATPTGMGPRILQPVPPVSYTPCLQHT